jgi:AraC-like DNA-binding protein
MHTKTAAQRLMSASPLESDRDLGLITLVDPAIRPFAGSLVQDEYDMDAPWHCHDMHQLQYAFEGSMVIEDDYGRHLLPRSLAGWIPAGTRHRNSLHRIRSVSVLLAAGSVPDSSRRIRILHVSPLMRAMLAESARWPLTQLPDATGQAFFLALARLCGEWIVQQAPLTLPTTRDAALARALSHVTVDTSGSQMLGAARAAGLSERTLRRRCQHELGMGWDEYRRRARLLAAIELLTDSSQGIARIAADVGFSSQSAFSRAFRRVMGKTPQAFREQFGR